MWLIDADVIFSFQPFNQLFDEFVQATVRLHLFQPLAHFFIQQIAVEQCLFNRASQVVECLLALEQIIVHVILESTLQQVIRKRAEQVLHAHFARWIGNVFAVSDASHKKVVSGCGQQPVTPLITSH